MSKEAASWQNNRMASFDLSRFRELAFGRSTLPDHPLQTVEDAKKMLAGLPAADPDACLAELTNWARSMNETAAFEPARRARILMILDDAARPSWRLMAERYLAPGGRPSERRDGDKAILRALFDSATEFNNGFAIALDEEPGDWIRRNHALLHVRVLRWLGRRLTLSYMLHLSAGAAIWERLHWRHQNAEQLAVARAIVPAFESDRLPSSPRQEYLRALLLELAQPESMRPRLVELAYRITGRIAASVELETARSDAAAFGVVPAGDARPCPLARLPSRPAAAPLYIGTASCLAKLRSLLERDMGRDPAEPDTLFGGAYTLRERFAVLNRLLEHWGMDPPQRRTKRIAMASAARVIHGYEAIAAVAPPWSDAEPGARGKARDLQLMIDDTTTRLKRSQLRAATRQGPARILDASTGGLGLAMRRADAPWAAHGVLVGVLIEPSKEWLLGVVRRVFAAEDELRLGVQVLTTKPRAMVLSTETIRRDSVWEEAMWHEATFKERFKRALLLEPQGAPLRGADVLLPASLASRNSQFEVFIPGGSQRICVTQLRESNEHYQHAAFEPLGTTVGAGMLP